METPRNGREAEMMEAEYTPAATARRERNRGEYGGAVFASQATATRPDFGKVWDDLREVERDYLLEHNRLEKRIAELEAKVSDAAVAYTLRQPADARSGSCSTATADVERLRCECAVCQARAEQAPESPCDCQWCRMAGIAPPPGGMYPSRAVGRPGCWTPSGAALVDEMAVACAAEQHEGCRGCAFARAAASWRPACWVAESVRGAVCRATTRLDGCAGCALVLTGITLANGGSSAPGEVPR